MRRVQRLVTRWVTATMAALLLLVGGASVAAAGQPAPDRKVARFEIRFMTNMIDHHAMAVRMAEMCQRKAVHGQLRAMCRTIATSQRHEIWQMRSWLREWYDADHAPAMTPQMHQQMAQMQRWSAARFEIHFMEMMIPHHRQAVREAQTCLDRADHRDLRQLCRNIIKTQTAEIRQMRAWLCDWYDRCRGRHEHQHGRPA